MVSSLPGTNGHGDLRQLCRTVVANSEMSVIIKPTMLTFLTGRMLHFEIRVGFGEVRTKKIILWCRQGQKALRALGMNTESKERKSDNDSFNDFMAAMQEGDE